MPCVLAALLCLTCPTARAYGPDGHKIVGAIADERLANTPVGIKLRSLLQGFSLEQAAVIPDEIKGWDKKGVDAPDIFRYTARPLVDAQLANFWRANPPTHDHSSPVPSHHWFHYTDVPLRKVQHYRDGKFGRSEWDIVQMIRYCLRVLRGDEPEDNPRKITKTIAIILLAHFVGDIHQPLHVGAEYFDAQGNPVDPDESPGALEDQGGNTITMRHTVPAAHKFAVAYSKLHGFWDGPTVTSNLPDFSALPKEERRDKNDAARRALALEFARDEPKAWRLPAEVKPEDYAESWADEIMPLAREAHSRLIISDVRPQKQEHGTVAISLAEERPMPDGLAYHVWAAAVVGEELHKAGWRLADLLEQALR
ncbi:MAG: S1/P1 nuclease [Chthoniobacterales bacterium]